MNTCFPQLPDEKCGGGLQDPSGAPGRGLGNGLGKLWALSFRPNYRRHTASTHKQMSLVSHRKKKIDSQTKTLRCEGMTRHWYTIPVKIGPNLHFPQGPFVQQRELAAPRNWAQFLHIDWLQGSISIMLVQNELVEHKTIPQFTKLVSAHFFLWMSHWTPKILFPMCLIEIGLGVSNLSSLPPFFKLAPAEKRPGNLGNSSEYHWCTCQCKILAWPVVQQYRGSKRHGATF